MSHRTWVVLALCAAASLAAVPFAARRPRGPIRDEIHRGALPPSEFHPTGAPLRESPPRAAADAQRPSAPRDDDDPTLASLLRRLRSPSLEIRADALVRLRTLGARAAPAAGAVLAIFEEGDWRMDGLAAATLAAMGPDVFPVLEDALRYGDLRVRSGVLRALERFQRLSIRATAALCGALVDPDASVRAAAAAAWAGHPEEITNGAAADLLARLLDPDAAVRAAAATTVGRLRLDAVAAVPAIARLAQSADEPEAVRLEAVWALARYETDAAPAVPALAEAATGGTPAVRREALRALSLLGAAAQDSAAALVRALPPAGSADRAAWVRALAAIAPERPEVMDVLLESVRADDAASGAAVSGLVAAGEAGTDALRIAASESAGKAAILASVVDAADGERGRAMRAALSGLLLDPSEELAELALRSLAAAGPEASDSVSAVATAAEHAPSSRLLSFARTLGEIGADSPVAARALLSVARRGEPSARVAAVRALGYVGVPGPDVLVYLDALAAGSDAALAREASRALARLRPTEPAATR